MECASASLAPDPVEKSRLKRSYFVSKKAFEAVPERILTLQSMLSHALKR